MVDVHLPGPQVGGQLLRLSAELPGQGQAVDRLLGGFEKGFFCGGGRLGRLDRRTAFVRRTALVRQRLGLQQVRLVNPYLSRPYLSRHLAGRQVWIVRFAIGRGHSQLALESAGIRGEKVAAGAVHSAQPASFTQTS
jgi:hypothetical protein